MMLNVLNQTKTGTLILVWPWPEEQPGPKCHQRPWKLPWRPPAVLEAKLGRLARIKRADQCSMAIFKIWLNH